MFVYAHVFVCTSGLEIAELSSTARHADAFALFLSLFILMRV
jgi:hypothetical protein